MAYGIEVRNSSNRVTWDTSGILGRIVGSATITFAANEYTTKSVTITGMLSTDKIFSYLLTERFATYSVTSSGTTVSINRTFALSGLSTTHIIIVVRVQ
jgi:hypothetical protein